MRLPFVVVGITPVVLLDEKTHQEKECPLDCTGDVENHHSCASCCYPRIARSTIRCRELYHGILLTLAVLSGCLLALPARASYDCDGANDRLELAAGVVSGYPFSTGGWIKDGELSVTDTIFGIGQDGSSTDGFFGNNASTNAVQACANDGSTSCANTSTTISETTTWHHVMFVFASATDRRVYLDGAGEGSATTSKLVTTPNNLIFCENNGNANDLTAKIGHWGLWENIALDATARSALAGGANPLAVEAANLAAYWPFVADAEDDAGANHLTVTGATLDVVDNPTVDPPPSSGGSSVFRGPFGGPTQ